MTVTPTVPTAAMSWAVPPVPPPPPPPHIHARTKRDLRTDVLVSVTAANVTLVPAVTPTPQRFPDRCSRGQFLCRRPPACIPDWQRCDGRPHCQDGSDEAHCRESAACSGA